MSFGDQASALKLSSWDKAKADKVSKDEDTRDWEDKPYFCFFFPSPFSYLPISGIFPEWACNPDTEFWKSGVNRIAVTAFFHCCGTVT